jgi:UDP-2,3-diacylglucosamine hydrolase
MVCRVGFVADLHLFTRRSDAAHYHGALCRAAARSQAFVLGGDIFDFRWSTLADTPTTVDAAIRWLEDLSAAHPDCHFHYLLGNHDYCRPLLERLEQRSGTMANLSWHRFYLRLGDSLFLHGDAAGRRMTPERLARCRARWLAAEPAGRFRRRAYDLFMETGLHRSIPYLVHTRRRAARRILNYLEHLGEGPQAGVRNVYFGHTHRRISNYRYRGLTFHNGGAPIAGQRLHILEALIEGGG